MTKMENRRKSFELSKTPAACHRRSPKHPARTICGYCASIFTLQMQKQKEKQKQKQEHRQVEFTVEISVVSLDDSLMPF